MKTTYTLKDIVTIHMGFNARGQVEEIKDGNTELLQMKDLTCEVIQEMPSLTKINLDARSSRFQIHAGDIIIRTRGKSFGTTYIQTEPLGPTCLAAPLMIIRVKENTPIHPAYLSWLMNQKSCQATLQHAAKGSTIPMIKSQDICDLVLQFHPYETQASIVEISSLSQELKQLTCELAEKKHQLIIATINK